MEDKEKRDCQDRRYKRIIALLFMFLIAAVGVSAYLAFFDHDDQRTAVIVSSDEELQSVGDSGQFRVRMSSCVSVQESTMQNLNFANNNEDRLLRCKIKVGGKYVYDSSYLEPGKTIKADVIDEDALEQGENKALAEIYSYDVETKEQMGQTNVNFTLVKS